MSTVVERLPSVIKIAGYDFRIVVWDDHAAMAAHRYGECSTVEQVIRVQRDFATPFNAVDTFLHELLHALYWAFGVNDDDKQERIVAIMGTALLTVHRDNPWLAGWISESLTTRNGRKI